MSPFYAEPRDIIAAKLSRALAPEVLQAAYGDVLVPEVSVGGKASAPPCEVIVRELPSYVTYDQLSTCPMPTVTWTCEVDLIATSVDLVAASDSVLAYADALVQVIAHDKRLGGLVTMAAPVINNVGTSATTDRRYLATIVAGVRFTADVPRNPTIKEALDA